MTDRSLLGAVVEDLDAMGPAPDLFEWANITRESWSEIRALVRAAENLIETWDASESDFELAEHIRAIRLALGITERGAKACHVCYVEKGERCR